MNKEPNKEELPGVYEICLEVFAGISAIVTHDIRNNLAVINENGGLLDDLVVMAGEQGAVPNKKARHIAASISEQVAQANKLMKNLNVFAHSNDTPSATLDLQETLDTMIALTRRKAMANKITVTAEGEQGILLTTSPLLLESLLYLCLTDMYATSASGSILVAEKSREDNSITLQLSTDCNNCLALTPSIQKKADLLVKAIDAEFCISDNMVAIRFPQ